MVRLRTAAVLLITALALAGCGGSMFGGPKPAKQEAAADPNAYPANYRTQVVALLRMALRNPNDFIGAMIAPPALKPVPNSQTQHYVVCLQFNDRTEHKSKVVIYFAGQPNEFVDATPEECGDAAYQPFPELQTAKPDR
jgi:hypothetical protein